MKYPIIVSLGGVPWDGSVTALEWYELKKLSDGTDIGSPPTFTKTGKGSFATSNYSPSEDLVGWVYINHADFSDAPSDRYVPVYLTAYDQGVKTIVDKLPSKPYLPGTNNSDGDIQLDEATGAIPDNTTILARLGTPVTTISGDIAAIDAAVVQGVAAPLTASGIYTLTTGTLISGLYTDTFTSDGTNLVFAPVTPAVGGFGLNLFLPFTCEVGQTVNTVTIRGYFNAGAARNCNVLAYNWVTLSWDQLSDSVSRMNTATSNNSYTYTLLPAHQKSDGTVNIAFQSASTTTGDRLNIDSIIVNVATAGATTGQIADAVYAKMKYTAYDGKIWINTVYGTAGTDIGVHGLPTNPVNNLADAITLATLLGVKRFYIHNGSSIVLNQTFEGWDFDGWEYAVDLNNQLINDSSFKYAHVSGVGASSGGDDVHFDFCYLHTVSFANAFLRKCILNGTITLTSGNTIMDECVDGTNSTGMPIIVFTDSAELQMRKFSGGVQFNGMIAGNDVVTDGAGRVIIHSSCTGGKVTTRGHFSITDNSSGLVTVVKTETFNTAQITANVPSVAQIQNGLATPTNITAGTITTVTNLTNAPTNGDFTTAMKNSLNAATPSVTVSDKTGFALTSDYDAAKTASTQTSVNAIPTNPLLTNDSRINYLDTSISSRLATNNVSAIDTLLSTNHGSGSWVSVSASSGSTPEEIWTYGNRTLTSATGGDATLANQVTILNNQAIILSATNAIPTNPLLTNDSRLNNIDASISSRLPSSSYTAPNNAGITAIQAKTNNLPANPAAVGSAMTLTSDYDSAKTASQLTRAQVAALLANRVNTLSMHGQKQLIDSYIIDGDIQVTVTYNSNNTPTQSSID